MPEEDIQNFKRNLGKNLEVHPVHGRDIKGKLIQIDPRLKVIYIEIDSATVQIPLKRISTIYWPKGFIPKVSNSEGTGEFPTDERGNHIRPSGTKSEVRRTTVHICQEHDLKFKSKRAYEKHLKDAHKDQGSESEGSTISDAIQDQSRPTFNIDYRNKDRV